MCTLKRQRTRFPRMSEQSQSNTAVWKLPGKLLLLSQCWRTKESVWCQWAAVAVGGITGAERLAGWRVAFSLFTFIIWAVCSFEGPTYIRHCSWASPLWKHSCRHTALFPQSKASLTRSCWNLRPTITITLENSLSPVIEYIPPSNSSYYGAQNQFKRNSYSRAPAKDVHSSPAYKQEPWHSPRVSEQEEGE